METHNTREVKVRAGQVVICDGLYTGQFGDLMGYGSSKHSIKLLVQGVERYEPDYALLDVTEDNEQAVRLLLSHHQELQKAREEAVREFASNLRVLIERGSAETAMNIIKSHSELDQDKQ